MAQAYGMEGIGPINDPKDLARHSSAGSNW